MALRGSPVLSEFYDINTFFFIMPLLPFVSHYTYLSSRQICLFFLVFFHFWNAVRLFA